NDANTKKPKSVSESVVSNPKINRDSVIIEDWISDDEEEVSEVQIVRPKTQTVKTRDDKSDQNSKKQGIDFRKGNPEILLKDHAMVDSGCSSHMTGNKAYLSDYKYFNGGFVAFESDPKGGKITGKGSSGKDKGPTQEYILLPLQPHPTRILVEDDAPAA
ncbi:hypothetical protein Tco_0288311, partial [Tanacetum coccineum]